MAQIGQTVKLDLTAIKALKTPQDFFYTRALYQFGLIPILITLAYFERVEDYEECAAIIAAIKAHNAEISDDMPTKYSDEAFEYIKALYKEKGWDFAGYIARLDDYAVQCFDFVVQKRKAPKTGDVYELFLRPYPIKFYENL